jgi:ABC-type transport system involved in multi-copper enzyme maturation permease subunit
MAPFLALFTSSLMLRTRSALVAWSRILLGGALFIALCWSQTGFATASAPGLDLLAVIARLASLGLGAVVLMSSAATITEEKQQQTLSLLRLTGLGAAGILGAKIGARLCECWLLLAVTLPLALLAATLGGVSVVQVLAVYCALATWFALLIGLGLFWSALADSATAAAGASLGTLVLFPVALAVLNALADHAALAGPAAPGAWDWQGLKDTLNGLTVFTRLDQVLATGYAGGITDAGDQVHLALALAFLLGAWLVFPPASRDDGVTPPSRMPRPRMRFGPVGWLGAPRPGAGQWALAWKEFHFTCGGRRGQVALIALVAVLTLSVRLANPGDALLVYRVLAGISGILLVLWIGLCLANVFNAELRANTLEDLITLPLHPAALFSAKLAGVARAGGPLAILAVLAALITVGFAPAPEELAVAVMLLAGSATLWYGCAFLSLVLPRGFAAVTILALVATGVGCAGGIILGLPFGEVTRFWTVLILSVMACIELHWAIVERLRVMAEG